MASDRISRNPLDCLKRLPVRDADRRVRRHGLTEEKAARILYAARAWDRGKPSDFPDHKDLHACPRDCQEPGRSSPRSFMGRDSGPPRRTASPGGAGSTPRGSPHAAGLSPLSDSLPLWWSIGGRRVVIHAAPRRLPWSARTRRDMKAAESWRLSICTHYPHVVNIPPSRRTRNYFSCRHDNRVPPQQGGPTATPIWKNSSSTLTGQAILWSTGSRGNWTRRPSFASPLSELRLTCGSHQRRKHKRRHFSNGH
jgi:hypothetical protein